MYVCLERERERIILGGFVYAIVGNSSTISDLQGGDPGKPGA